MKNSKFVSVLGIVLGFVVYPPHLSSAADDPDDGDSGKKGRESSASPADRDYKVGDRVVPAEERSFSAEPATTTEKISAIKELAKTAKSSEAIMKVLSGYYSRYIENDPDCDPKVISAYFESLAGMGSVVIDRIIIMGMYAKSKVVKIAAIKAAAGKDYFLLDLGVLSLTAEDKDIQRAAQVAYENRGDAKPLPTTLADFLDFGLPDAKKAALQVVRESCDGTDIAILATMMRHASDPSISSEVTKTATMLQSKSGTEKKPARHRSVAHVHQAKGLEKVAGADAQREANDGETSHPRDDAKRDGKDGRREGSRDRR